MLRNLLLAAVVVSTLVGCGKDRKEEAEKANAEIAAANAQVRAAEVDHRKLDSDWNRLMAGHEARTLQNYENVKIGYERVRAKYQAARDNTQSALDRVKESNLFMSDKDKRTAKNNLEEIGIRLREINRRITLLQDEIDRIIRGDVIPSLKPGSVGA